MPFDLYYGVCFSAPGILVISFCMAMLLPGHRVQLVFVSPTYFRTGLNLLAGVYYVCVELCD